MRHLALETSTATCSLAALDGPDLLASVNLDPDSRSAKALAPALAQLLKNIDWRARHLQLISVTLGPGSFTGLRVGVTTAKTLAYVAQAEVIGVNTLEAIAWAATPPREILSTVFDAFRGQVFTQRFTRDAQGQVRSDDEVRIVERDDYLNSLTASGVRSVAGPMLPTLIDQLPRGVSPVERSLWSPSAASVGQLAWRRYQAGGRDNLWTLLPNYYRKSAAEEKLENT